MIDTPFRHSPRFAHAPHNDEGYTMPLRREVPHVKAIEEDRFGGVLISAALECGATTRDIAELLSQYYKLPAPRTLDTQTFRDYLGNFGRTMDKSGPSRREQYFTHIRALHPISDPEVARIRRALLEQVRNRIREHSPRDFWQNDAMTRACMIPLLKKMHAGHVGTQDIHFVLVERLGLDMTHNAIKVDFLKYRAQYTSADFMQHLHTTPTPLDGSLVTQAEALVAEWLTDLDVIRDHGTLNESHAEWKRDQTMALVAAGLFEIHFSEDLLLRRKVARGVIPLTSMSRIISQTFEVPAHTDSFKLLLDPQKSTPDAYKNAAVILRKMHNVAESDERAQEGKKRAEQLWDSYFAGVDARSRLEASIFRNPHATALAVVLLEQTDFSSMRIARIIQSRYAEDITPDQFGMIVRRMGGRNEAAAYIRKHATFGSVIFQTAEHVVPDIVSFETEIDAHRQKKFPEITELFADFRAEKRRGAVHLQKVDVPSGRRDEDGLPIMKPSLQITFAWEHEILRRESTSTRALVIALVRAARELEGGTDNELSRGLKRIGCIGVSVYATRTLEATYAKSRYRLAWYLRKQQEESAPLSEDKPGAEVRDDSTRATQPITPAPAPQAQSTEGVEVQTPEEKLLTAIRARKTTGRVHIASISQLARYDEDTKTMHMRQVLVISLSRISGDDEATAIALKEQQAQKEYMSRVLRDIEHGVRSECIDMILSQGYDAVTFSSDAYIAPHAQSKRKEWTPQRKTVIFPDALKQKK